MGFRWEPSTFTTRPSSTRTSRLQASGQSRGQAEVKTSGARSVSVMGLFYSEAACPPSLTPGQIPHPCPLSPHLPPAGRGEPIWSTLACLPLLPAWGRGWSGEEGRGDEGLGRGSPEAQLAH